MHLELTQPVYLLGILLTGPAILIWRRSLVDLSPRQRQFSLLIRLSLIILIALALSGPILQCGTHEKMTVFLLDRSLSIDDQARQFSREFVSKALEKQKKDPFVIMEFAESPRIIAASGAASTFSEAARFKKYENILVDNYSLKKSNRKGGLKTSKEGQAEIETPGEKKIQDADAFNEKAGSQAGDFTGSDFLKNNDNKEVGHNANSNEQGSETADNWSRVTNLALALGTATAELSPQRVGRIVLLSDGNETTGSALVRAQTLGVPVSTVLLPGQTRPEIQLAELRIPPQVRKGEPFQLEVVVRSNRRQDGTVTIYRGEYKLVEQIKKLEKGENRFFFRQSLDQGHREIYSAAVTGPEDTILDNNRASNIVFAEGRPRVLLIDDDAKSVRQFVSGLKRQDLEIEVRKSGGIPKTLEEFENYDAIFLSNVSALSLTKKQMDLLAVYVRDLGGGLIVSGGDQSFGLGGYYNTSLDEILPVRSRFEKEKEKPSLALALVIDRSGSMGGEKIELAKDAAKGAVELLTARDYITIIAFDHDCYPVVPVQAAGSAYSVSNMIGTIEAAGGTNIYPALDEAFQQMKKVSAKLKHVILLTDGYSEQGDYDSIVQQMKAQRITLSTVGIGGADNELLEYLAKLGGGRHYVCENSDMIPQVFSRETTIAGKSGIAEEPFVPQWTGPTDVLSGIDFQSVPPLLGYVKTKEKPTAQIILTTEKGEPLLSWWRYGLGMSAAYTSDIKNRWGAEWLVWPDHSIFWAQIVRHCMKRSDSGKSNVQLIQKQGRAELLLDAVDDRDSFIDQADGTFTVVGPDLVKMEKKMIQTAPGRYQSAVELSQKGCYHFHWSLQTENRTIVSRSGGLITGYCDELKLSDPDRELMKQIAETTGGVFEPDPGDLFKEDRRLAWRAVPLWPFLLITVMILYTVDLLLRRVDFGSARSGKYNLFFWNQGVRNNG